MKQMTRWVEVKNSQEEITNKHEGKPIIYLVKFSGSGHLFSTFSFLGTNLTQANVSLICEPLRQVVLRRQGLFEHGFCRDKFTFSRIDYNKNSVSPYLGKLENESIVLCSIQISTPL